MSTEKRDFDEAAPTWDQEPRRLKLASDVARAIIEAAQPSREMDVLDFGCGTGLLTLQLQPLVRSITGIDRQFHSDNEGVFHNGFPEAEVRQAFAAAGLADVRYRIAAKVPKPVTGGAERVFTIFLINRP
jgi:hypothetical protein